MDTALGQVRYRSHCVLLTGSFLENTWAWLIGILIFAYVLCRYEDTKEDLDEFQASSQELEAEMEVQLEQSEKKVKDLMSHNERLQTELDQLRVS